MKLKGRRNNIQSILLTLLVIAAYLLPNLASAVSVFVESLKPAYENSEVAKFNLAVNIEDGERIPVQSLKLKINDTLKECEFRPDGTFISDCTNLKIIRKDLFNEGFGYGYNSGYGYGHNGYGFETANTVFGYGYGYAGYGYGYGYGYGVTDINKRDGENLDKVIAALKSSLSSQFWINKTHLNTLNGAQVFDKEKEAVELLENIIEDEQSSLSKSQLLDLIMQIVNVDRNLAIVAVQDARNAGASEAVIDAANAEIASGDAEAGTGNYANAIAHYKEAWKKAVEGID